MYLSKNDNPLLISHFLILIWENPRVVDPDPDWIRTGIGYSIGFDDSDPDLVTGARKRRK
jgi:hypothetical protein